MTPLHFPKRPDRADYYADGHAHAYVIGRLPSGGWLLTISTTDGEKISSGAARTKRQLVDAARRYEVSTLPAGSHRFDAAFFAADLWEANRDARMLAAAAAEANARLARWAAARLADQRAAA